MEIMGFMDHRVGTMSDNGYTDDMSSVIKYQSELVETKGWSGYE